VGDSALRAADIYLNAFLPRAEQVLGMLDREAFSPTFGCLDRTYWAWKFTDFAGARFQEGLYFLSFLYATKLPTNPYFQNPRMLEWIAGGFDFWSKLQRKSGDFDEAYPYERSLAATAFTTFYVSEAYRLVGGALPDDTVSRFRDSAGRAARWLTQNDETHGFLSNHLAAAAAALAHAHRLIGDDAFASRSRYFRDRILGRQSSEGWYEEYGGADPGYQTHGSFYLARLAELTDDDELEESLQRATRFLAHFAHPDGSLGGEYASRNTQTYYPAAFEMLADRIGSARWITEKMLPSVESRAAAGLGSVDAFNLFPLLNNYVFAYQASRKRGARGVEAEVPDEGAGTLHFPQAGLVKVRREGFELVVGTAKGGVIKLFDLKDRVLKASDCGYVGRLRNGKLISSQWLVPDRPVTVREDEIFVEGNFFQFARPLMSPWRFLAFRLFSLTAGRIPTLAMWLKAVLVRTLIYKKRAIDLRLRRRIRVLPDGVEVIDQVDGLASRDVAAIATAPFFSTIHMGSSRYFVPNEVAGKLADGSVQIDGDALRDGSEWRRTFHV